VRRLELFTILTLGLLFLVGLAGHALAAALPWMLLLTPYFLLLAGLSVLLPVLWEGRRRLWWWALVVLVVTFFVEAAGTATGRIFGPYTYGATLGPMLLAVPVVIAFNWLLVILGATSLAERVIRRLESVRRRGAQEREAQGRRRPAAGGGAAPGQLRPLPVALAAVLAAGLAAGFDFVLEPTAVRLQYWVWHAAGIPLQNYLAWFLVALAAALAFMLLRLSARSRLPLAYFLIQLGFFGALRFLPPGSVGA
jgi:putative membrane protein